VVQGPGGSEGEGGRELNRLSRGWEIDCERAAETNCNRTGAVDIHFALGGVRRQEETGRAGSLSIDRSRKIKEIRKFSRQLTRPLSGRMNIPLLSFGRPRRSAISKKQPVPLDKTLHIFSIRYVFVTCEHATTGDLIGRVVPTHLIPYRARAIFAFIRSGVSRSVERQSRSSALALTQCAITYRRDVISSDRRSFHRLIFILVARAPPGLISLTDDGGLHFRLALVVPCTHPSSL